VIWAPQCSTAVIATASNGTRTGMRAEQNTILGMRHNTAYTGEKQRSYGKRWYYHGPGLLEVYALNYNHQTNTTISDHLAIFAGYYASIGGLQSMQVFSFSRRSHSSQSEGQTCRWGEKWLAALRTPWRRYLKCLQVILKCDPQ